MNWFYVSGGQQTGPVDDTEWQRLIQSGVISSETLVWKEGMPEWQPWGQVSRPNPAAPASADAAEVMCANCGRSFQLNQVVRLAGNYVCPTCKPVALQKLSEGVGSVDPAEEIRRAHLNHEASLKSVGLLYYLGSVFLVLLGVAGAIGTRTGSPVLGLLFLVLGVVQLFAARGLRQLKSWARIPTLILSIIGLIGFPIGTLINGYIIYLVFSKKGSMVFSDEYKEIIARTPHIKYRTSIIVWILLALLVLGLIAAIMVPLLAVRR